jgi:hypothetical protein
VQLDADERVEVATPSSSQYAIRSTTVLASTSLLVCLDLPRSVSGFAVDSTFSSVPMNANRAVSFPAS